MSPQLNHLIDTAMQRLESLLALLVGARAAQGRHSEALSIAKVLDELHVLLAVLARVSTRH